MDGFLWQPEDHTVRQTLLDGPNKTSAQHCVSLITSLLILLSGALYASNVWHEGAEETYKFHLHLSVVFTYWVSCHLENRSDTLLTVFSDNCSEFISY